VRLLPAYAAERELVYHRVTADGKESKGAPKNPPFRRRLHSPLLDHKSHLFHPKHLTTPIANNPHPIPHNEIARGHPNELLLIRDLPRESAA
jgi:hypothetical protein